MIWLYNFDITKFLIKINKVIRVSILKYWYNKINSNALLLFFFFFFKKKKQN